MGILQYDDDIHQASDALFQRCWACAFININDSIHQVCGVLCPYGLDVSHLCIILYKIYYCVVLYKMFTLLQIKYTYIHTYIHMPEVLGKDISPY